jgi:hypothetical protein
MYKMVVFLLCWISVGCASYTSTQSPDDITRVDQLQGLFEQLNLQIADPRLSHLDEVDSGIQGLYLLRIIRKKVINDEIAAYLTIASVEEFNAIYKKANPLQRQVMIEFRNKK